LKVEAGRGPVDLRAGHGDIALLGREGAANLQTGNGTIIVDRHRGSLRVRSDSGLSQLFVQEPLPPGIDVRTSGSVQLHLPRDFAFTLAATAPRGDCRNAFGVPVERGEGSRGWRMRAAVRAGELPVEVHSSHGNVSVGTTD
jgi:hypothetical protein